MDKAFFDVVSDIQLANALRANKIRSINDLKKMDVVEVSKKLHNTTAESMPSTIQEEQQRALRKIKFKADIQGAPYGDERLAHPVIIIPGIMGSRLKRVDGVEVWSSLWTIWRHFDELILPPFKEADSIEANEIMDSILVTGDFIHSEGYRELTNILEDIFTYRKNQTLFEFAYDWRKSNADSAVRLKEKVNVWKTLLPESMKGKKFAIIAHSMGGLVAKYYINELEGYKDVDILLLIGTPNEGSTKALKIFNEGLGNPVNMIMGGVENVRRVVFSFPSVFELLPHYPDCCKFKDGTNINIFDVQVWKKYGLIPKYKNIPEEQTIEYLDKQLKSALAFYKATKVLKKVKVYKIISDKHSTPATAVFNSDISLKYSYGDATVTSESAKAATPDPRDNNDFDYEKHGALFVSGSAQSQYDTWLIKRHFWEKSSLYEFSVGFTKSSLENANKGLMYSSNEQQFKGIGNLDVTLDKIYYGIGDPIDITVRVVDVKGILLRNLHIEATLNDKTIPLDNPSEDFDLYRAKFNSPSKEGTYSIKIDINDGKATYSIHEYFMVLPQEVYEGNP